MLVVSGLRHEMVLDTFETDQIDEQFEQKSEPLSVTTERNL